MKKLSKIILVVFACMMIIGCGKSNTEDPKPPIEDNQNEENQNENNNNDTTVKTEIKKVRIFCYNAADDKQEYFEKEVSVTNGAIVNALFTSLKELDSSYVLPANTTVKSAVKEDKTLTVDFAGNITPDNLGGGIEASFLLSVVNTFGYNMDVKTVIININGAPYSSGHYTDMENGFTVDYNGWNKK